MIDLVPSPPQQFLDQAMNLVTNLLGARCKAVAKPGWIRESGSPELVTGSIEAIAYERDFVFIVMDDRNIVYRVQTITHDIQIL